MRFLVLLALAPACYVQGRGQVSTTYGGGGIGGGFMLTDEHQDGELGIEGASSRLPPQAGEPDAPFMLMAAARYAHAVDPAGHVRLYVRGAVGDEMCPSDAKLAAADGCVPTKAQPDPLDVPHSSIVELGAGVALTLAKHDEHDPVGWSLGAVSVGAVHSTSSTRERGTGDFTGIDLALTFGFDALAPLANSKKHD